MTYDYDIITIGLGPAGMAVSIMGSEMGLKVCGIEKHKVGGECMNVGCIPSKALIRIAKARHIVRKYERLELAETDSAAVKRPFARIQGDLDYISENKTLGLFSKVDMVHQEGAASFVDRHTVQVGDRRLTARRIYICSGTRPAVPDFPGLADLDYLTNENLFQLVDVPESMIVLGGGAIACEMAQAFARLGSRVTMVIRGKQLIWREGREVCDLLEESFTADGVTILREQSPTAFRKLADGGAEMETSAGEHVTAEKVLVATGRRMDFGELQLENAGIVHGPKGIQVDRYLRTSAPNVYACGDCNGWALFSHAAMHQGMLALMNSLAPWPFKRDYRRYVVPWTIFTDPQISHVGRHAGELEEEGIRYQELRVNYADYGAAIAEALDVGFVRAYAGKFGRVHGATIVGEGSGEMINEWALIVQNRIRLSRVMLLQHSFPTMGFLSKRVSETWAMGWLKSRALQGLCRLLFRVG